MGAEPKVVATGVRRVLRDAINPDDPDAGEAVQVVAERAATSTRTVYRVLGGEISLLKLDLADRLALAVGRHLTEIGCEVELTDGRRVDYRDA